MAGEQVWTIGRLLKWSAGYFASHGVDTPRLDAEVLLAHALGEKRIYLYIHHDKPLEAEELAAYRAFVKRRAAREPVAYITGKREFMGLVFQVTPDVLVPQPDTEIVVGAVLDRLRGVCGERIADIGTGSGAIALSLLHYLPSLAAAAVDVSAAALRVAKENAVRLELTERVTFYEGDLLAPLAGETFDAIVSNPPYIPAAAIDGLAPEVQAEPRLALDGGADGLSFYRRLLQEAAAFLEPGGFLALEAGDGAAVSLKEMALAHGWRVLEAAPDLAGIERVVMLARP